MLRSYVRSLFIFVVLGSACGLASDRESDGVDDAFGEDALDRATSCAVLKLVNDANEDTLAHAVRLDPRAAARIATHRDGPDGEAGSR